jgi:hypothetical protein
MKLLYLTGLSLLLFFSGSCNSNDNKETPQKANLPIKISETYPKYFETVKGETWIPIMINYLPAEDRNNADDTYEFTLMEDYFKKFSGNGGNSMRIWISNSFLEIEDTEEGKYNASKFDRIDKLLDLAEKYGIYIKFTLQHIRSIASSSNNEWSNSRTLAGTFKNIDEYVTTMKGINSYLNRARALAKKYKNHKQIYAWELWNEMDALPNNTWPGFTRVVLDSVKQIFPNHLVVQTLGSLHSPYAEDTYKRLFTYNSNEFVSIHRYLDLGTDWGQYAYTKGDIDTLESTAIHFAQTYVHDRPIIMNETGAVEPNHIGPFNYYKTDREGILIHDMIFAPFFCGAAGSGGMWHWDHYIYPNNLWYHFQRFKNAIADIDPIKEKFENFTFESNGVRCFGLRGQTKTIIWGRDASCNWRTEFEQGITPQPKTDLSFIVEDAVKIKYTSAKVYLPWEDSWSNVTLENGRIDVPAFTRSVVIVLQ